MTISTPSALRLEHQALHDELARVSHEPGALGEAAALVARLLRPHAGREEAFALPPLGLLADLARGRVEEYMASAIGHAEWLKNNLADMLAEHRAIVGALERLVAAARAAQRFDCVELAEKLMVHARMEEEVLYPAAILVGEYLKLKLRAGASA